jgi:hypothetical protein
MSRIVVHVCMLHCTTDTLSACAPVITAGPAPAGALVDSFPLVFR